MKEKNKSLLKTSLISVAMCIIPFSVMANTSMEQGDKLASTVKTVNAEQNTAFPATDNAKALYTSSKPEQYRVQPNNESFPFLDVNNNPINMIDTTNNNGVPSAYNSEVGYRLTGNETIDANTGFISGHKEVEDSGNGSYKGMFFRYWDPSATSTFEKQIQTDAQYSPSFPKLCYTGATSTYPTENKISNNKPTHPLIRLASIGGDSSVNQNNKMMYGGSQNLSMPVVPMSENDFKKANIAGVTWTNTGINTLICDTAGTKCSLTWTGNCLKINPYGAIKLANPDPATGYNYVLQKYTNIVNCATSSTTSCAAADVKSFKGDTSNEAYRISQFVRLDINGNTDPIEIPQQTCYKCLNVQTSGVEDTSCSYIVNEVFKAKGGNCAETVKALATNPRVVKDYLPSDMNTEYNCKNCLCKIETLLRAKGCN